MEIFKYLKFVSSIILSYISPLFIHYTIYHCMTEKSDIQEFHCLTV